MTIVIPDAVVERATEYLHEHTDICDAGSDTCDTRRVARELLEHAFAEVNPVGQWWIGATVTDPRVDVIYIKFREAGAGVLLRNNGDGDTYDRVPHSVDFRWSKSGHLTYFHVAKIEPPKPKED